jgi:hypothetical protein
MGWMTGVQYPAVAMMRLFLFATASRQVLESTQPRIQWTTWAITPGVKRPGSEADCSPPASAEVRNGWSYSSTSPIRLHAVVLK